MVSCQWLLFVSHLPSRESTPRMRVWRGLRALGAAILRDGVYLLPLRSDIEQALSEHAATVHAAGGSAHLVECPSRSPEQAREFAGLFRRDDDYTGWHASAADLMSRLPQLNEPAARREEAVLRRALEAILAIDFFPEGDTRDRALAEMAGVSEAVNAHFSPGEPSAVPGAVTVRDKAQYRGRVWATRRGLWVDRVACAWLIRRFVDDRARFAWLAHPAKCPPGAVGFDFDGAEFSHVGERVTFQVLLQAFALEHDAALARLGALVRYLDTGGAPVAEAVGVLALLGAARERCADDDDFLLAARLLLDDLYAAFAAPAPRRRATAGR